MSVFRELFIEVPVAILEAALKEKLEARESENRFVAASRAAQLHMNLEYAVREICKSRGIELIDTFRLTDADAIVLRVRLKCRHVGHFLLDETVLVRMRGAREIVEYVLDTLEKPAQRRCSCVEFVPQPKCTAGACK